MLEHFKLKEEPFKITPNPRYLYMAPQHVLAIDKCQYVISNRGGLVVIYGEVGMGKTTIARQLVSKLEDEDNYLVASLITPALKSENALLRAIMDEFKVPFKRSYYLSLTAFQDFTLEAHEAGQNLVIVIDEAQKLTPKMLDTLHTLLNFESNTEKFLQIVLIGQKELAENIDKFRPIKSRVAIFGELTPLTEDDSNDLISFRWQTATGAKAEHPFEPDALHAIYQYSGGIPREIIKLCNESLMVAFDRGLNLIDKEMIKEAAKDLRLEIVKGAKQ